MPPPDPPTFALLPTQSGPKYFKFQGEDPTPLFRLKTQSTYRSAFFNNGQILVILDQAGKRLTVCRVLPEKPWLETLSPPQTLPRSFVGKCFAYFEGQVFVGGYGKTSESIWMKTSPESQTWIELPLPGELRAFGKHVDALCLDGDRMIAVDDFFIPKFNVTYRLERDRPPQLLGHHFLPVHTTYEHVMDASLGPEGLAVLSRGMNHGRQSAFIALLDAKNLTERRVWMQSRDLRGGSRKAVDMNGGLLSANYLQFFQGKLWVACGTKGLFAYSFPKKNE